jgi:predicted metal-dependent hydrolase
VEDVVAAAYERGLELVGRGEYFAAHEALEEAWRVAVPEERDFFQGLVHVVVAWHHASVTRRIVARERQLAKAARRLTPYAPAHRGLDVADLLGQVERELEARTDAPVRIRRRSPEPRTRG